MSNFRRIGARGVKSDDGFEITFRGLKKLLYSERPPSAGNRAVTIHFETSLGQRGGYDLFFGKPLFDCWDPPHEKKMISAAERDQIVKNVTDALDFLRLPYTLSFKDVDNATIAESIKRSQRGRFPLN